MVRKDVLQDGAWDAGEVNAYASSDIDAWFNGTYKGYFSTAVQAMMESTTFYYTPKRGNNSVSTLGRAVFALSFTELGQPGPTANTEGSVLPTASTLQVARRNGSPTSYWTRSPDTIYDSRAFRITNTGKYSVNHVDVSYGYRPAFTLSSGAAVDEDLNLLELMAKESLEDAAT